MRMTLPALMCAVLASGCETIDESGGGYLTHSSHRLTAQERASVETGMRAYLKVPVAFSGLSASYRLADGGVAVCGYVSGSISGKSTPPSLFGGTLLGSSFVPLRVPGKGQDAQRIAAVRAFCQSEQINI
ncbi:MAG TPA: hypothetical protein VIZ90_16170 [Rhizobiaceae bacterium]